ncbi:NAD kinase [Hufsiella ginkgonis]|uniref:NAD kinase n=1 Tax=Hufsiella ginkgonis TaxID=2695274 RepID=A0A7K1Y3U7_9SPHI|nr:NAD kinase [Hufsiella ginkgonis]MXV17788.1 NAD kinase [Hufsiella ginkgonis]
MKIAVYGREFNQSVLPYVQDVFDALAEFDVEVIVAEAFNRFISGNITFRKPIRFFNGCEDLRSNADILLSLGGDGTMLDAVTLIRDSGIPVIGINFGRLGFLASINKDDVRRAIGNLVNQEFTLDPRALLTVEADRDLFDGQNFALNDVTIHRRDNSAMMIIHAYLNDEFLNSYWADGLIVATPTGSTAYSLSCGGPIVFPQSGNFVVTPVSPHNLNVRPVILSDSNVLRFEIEGRSSKYLLSCDSRTETISNSIQLKVCKAGFQINLVRLNNESYLSTLRKKLLWGIDTRNY